MAGTCTFFVVGFLEIFVNFEEKIIAQNKMYTISIWSYPFYTYGFL